MADNKTGRRRIAPATIALIAAALIALVAIVIAATRSGEQVDPGAGAAAQGEPGNVQGGGVNQMISTLAQRVRQEPDNAQAWYMLGITLRDGQRYPEAEQALRRAMQLQPNNPDHVASLAEALLLVGRENPPREAQALFRRALTLRPDHASSRFYLAVLKDVAGNHREAVDDLLALIRDAPAGAQWEPQVRSVVQAIARQNNIDIANRLPPPRAGAAGPPATVAAPGPSRQQMDAAGAMPAGQQDQMIRGMVDRLAARLQRNPRDAEGWIRLMQSRMVLSDPAGATAALRSGLAAFGDDAATQQRLRTSAQQLGVPAG